MPMKQGFTIPPGDHTQKYYSVNGHPVILSFSRSYNAELYDRLRQILLRSAADRLADGTIGASGQTWYGEAESTIKSAEPTQEEDHE